ncbi:MAG TPA: hypothetical protein VGB79_07265 [Allosphingosinicella sp.]|jgi:hypothetical protein
MKVQAGMTAQAAMTVQAEKAHDPTPAPIPRAAAAAGRWRCAIHSFLRRALGGRIGAPYS